MNFEFVSRAVGDRWPIMAGIHFNREHRRLEGTDGRRLHIYRLNDAEFDSLQEDIDKRFPNRKSDIFLFEKVKNKIITTEFIDGQFLGCQRIIEQHDDAKEVKIDIYFEKIGTKIGNPESKKYYKKIQYCNFIYLLNNAGILVNHDFIKDLYGITWERMVVKNPEYSFSLHAGAYSAYIMPIKPPEGNPILKVMKENRDEH